MNEQLYKRNKTNRDFLLSFFDKPDEYQVKEINEFYLIKQFSKRLQDWTVALFSKEAFKNKKKHQEQFKGKRYKVTRRNRR